MKNIFKYSIFLIFVMSLFSACKKENRCDCIKRTGTIISETRNVFGFDRITVEDNLNVFLTHDSLFSVVVEAGENVAPLIRTEVNAGTLTIKNDNRCNWTRSYDKPMNVHVSMPKINYILSDGTGKITGLNLITTDSFDVRIKNSGDIDLMLNNKKLMSRIHGSGDLILHGKTKNHFCNIGGTGYLQSSNLLTDYTYLHTNTLGLCYIRCSGTVECLIDSQGDVYCYGNPTSIIKQQSGSGQLYLQ